MPSFEIGVYESTSNNPYVLVEGEIWKRFPIDGEDGFPQVFPVKISDRVYQCLFYINKNKFNQFLALRMTDEDNKVIFNRKISEKLRYYINEFFDFYVEQLELSTDDPFLKGNNGNVVIAGVFIK